MTHTNAHTNAHTNDHATNNSIDAAIDAYVANLFLIPSDDELIALIENSEPLIDAIPMDVIGSGDFDFIEWLTGDKGIFTYNPLFDELPD